MPFHGAVVLGLDMLLRIELAPSTYPSYRRMQNHGIFLFAYEGLGRVKGMERSFIVARCKAFGFFLNPDSC